MAYYSTEADIEICVDKKLMLISNKVFESLGNPRKVHFAWNPKSYSLLIQSTSDDDPNGANVMQYMDKDLDCFRMEITDPIYTSLSEIDCKGDVHYQVSALYYPERNAVTFNFKDAITKHKYYNGISAVDKMLEEMRCPIHNKPPVFVSGFIQKCCCDEFTEEVLTRAEELILEAIPEIDGYDDDDWDDEDE